MLAHCDTIHLQRLYCASSADALRVFTSAALEGKLGPLVLPKSMKRTNTILYFFILFFYIITIARQMKSWAGKALLCFFKA
jgi:hypothetical protein